MFESNQDINTGYDFQKIETPTLIIHAKDDPSGPFSGAEKLNELITNSKLVAIEEGGHVMLGQ